MFKDNKPMRVPQMRPRIFRKEQAQKMTSWLEMRMINLVLTVSSMIRHGDGDSPFTTPVETPAQPARRKISYLSRIAAATLQ